MCVCVCVCVCVCACACACACVCEFKLKNALSLSADCLTGAKERLISGQKLCEHQFHVEYIHMDQIWIFWVSLNLFGWKIMCHLGICQVQICRFVRAKSVIFCDHLFSVVFIAQSGWYLKKFSCLMKDVYWSKFHKLDIYPGQITCFITNHTNITLK